MSSKLPTDKTWVCLYIFKKFKQKLEKELDLFYKLKRENRF